MTRTLFIVSSQSGTTTEPNVLKDYFFARVAAAIGKDQAGGHGSTLEKTAKADRFRRVFLGQPNIGGRYSVLSPFGLVPAAAGIDSARLLETAQAIVRSCHTFFLDQARRFRHVGRAAHRRVDRKEW